jgi:hypothetical protein
MEVRQLKSFCLITLKPRMIDHSDALSSAEESLIEFIRFSRGNIVRILMNVAPPQKSKWFMAARDNFASRTLCFIPPTPINALQRRRDLAQILPIPQTWPDPIAT